MAGTPVSHRVFLPLSMGWFGRSPVTCPRSAGVSVAGLRKQLSGRSISRLLILRLGYVTVKVCVIVSCCASHIKHEVHLPETPEKTQVGSVCIVTFMLTF